MTLQSPLAPFLLVLAALVAAWFSAGILPWGVMRHPSWAAWQRESPRIANAFLDNGQADVLFLLNLAYSQDNKPLSGPYPNDPVRRSAHQITLRRSQPGRANERDFTVGIAQILKPAATALLPRSTGPNAPAPSK